jgi:hypothetical protein
MNEFFAFMFVLASLALFTLAFFVHLFFALGVMRDGDRIRTAGGNTHIVGPGAWAMAVMLGFPLVLGGLVVVALYWWMHHANSSASATKPTAGP